MLLAFGGCCKVPGNHYHILYLLGLIGPRRTVGNIFFDHMNHSNLVHSDIYKQFPALYLLYFFHKFIEKISGWIVHDLVVQVLSIVEVFFS